MVSCTCRKCGASRDPTLTRGCEPYLVDKEPANRIGAAYAIRTKVACDCGEFAVVLRLTAQFETR